jgi:hypothetical protein
MNTESPTVYVVQHSPGKDLMPAKEYGPLRILLSKNDTRTQHFEGIINSLQQGLSRFRPEDYLLLIGDPVAIAIAAHIAMHNTRGFLRLLRWNRETYSYEPINIGVVQ